MPPCRSPTVFILLRSTPRVTRVWAISGDRPVTITIAPRSREASTVRTRWFATFESMAGTPVMSITTTLARLVRMARKSCSVRWRALGQTLGVGLQRLEGSRLQGIEVVVVDGRGLREYLVPAHRGE